MDWSAFLPASPPHAFQEPQPCPKRRAIATYCAEDPIHLGVTCRVEGCRGYEGHTWFRLLQHVRREHGMRTEDLQGTFLHHAGSTEQSAAQNLRRMRSRRRQDAPQPTAPQSPPSSQAASAVASWLASLPVSPPVHHLHLPPPVVAEEVTERSLSVHAEDGEEVAHRSLAVRREVERVLRNAGVRQADRVRAGYT